MMRRGLLALFLGTVLQAAGPGGPVPGWTLDNRNATIRAVTGIPGAMRLADPIALPNGIAAVEFSSSGDLALAITTDQPAHLLAISALHTSPAAVDLGAISDGSRILGLNQKGTAGIVYSPSIQSVLFVSGLDRTPSLSAPVSTAGLAGPITAGLLEDNGTCAVLGTGSIETLCADASSRRVIQDTGLSVTSLALANGSQDLWIADAAAKQVSRVSGYANQSSAYCFRVSNGRHDAARSARRHDNRSGFGGRRRCPSRLHNRSGKRFRSNSFTQFCSFAVAAAH